MPEKEGRPNLSIARYSRPVNLDDLNNVHTFAVLSTRPGSRVLDLGAGAGSVARALRDRGCVVTAVERDPDGVEALRDVSARVLAADLETLGSEAFVPEFDVVLLLDVLEHLRDPATVLTRAAGWLAPHGRLLISLPNVAHGAVRLALLQGRWESKDVGLLDRTHVHYFDAAGVDTLLRDSGLAALERLEVVRPLGETEIDIDLSSYPEDVLETLRADALATVYQFFVVARPAGVVPSEAAGTLAEALLERVRTLELAHASLESAYRALERHAGALPLHTDDEVTAADDAAAYLAMAADLDTDVYIDTTVDVGLAADAERLAALWLVLQDERIHRDMLEEQLTERVTELRDAADTLAVLMRDTDVQRAYAEDLAAQLPRIIALGGEEQVIARLDAFHRAVGDPESAARMAAAAAELARLQQTAAFRLLGRLDALLRRMPRVRALLQTLVRRAAPPDPQP